MTDLLRALIAAGKRRTAGKLRAYLRSAFEMARTAGMDASLPVRFKAYGVKHNPVADTKAIQGDTAKAPLSIEELRQYWQAIKDLQTFQGAVLRLHLLMGGQRLEQFCRLRRDDTQPTEIILWDGKGRPGRKPRPHPLPLTLEAQQALKEVRAWAPVRPSRDNQTEGKPGTFTISIDGGVSRLSANALAKWSKRAGAGISGFSAKRIRSGVETALAGLRVSKEDRGHLLSHGVGGVQANSYDGHDYMAVKLSALQALHRFLKAQDAVVIPGAFGRVA